MSRRSAEEKQGKRRANGLRAASGSWIGFIDIPLSLEDKTRLAELLPEDYPDFMEFIETLLADGYKFSLARDETHHCDICTITGRGEGCPNAGYSLSSRGPSLEGAILATWYKHVQICEEQRWEGHADASSSQLSLWD